MARIRAPRAGTAARVRTERLVRPPSASPTSVVVMTRNRAPRLAHTLRMLAELSASAPVIVVDNGSTDDTAQLVMEEFPQVSFVGLEGNVGALARNVGVSLVTTPYVAFSDDDSWWAGGALEDAGRIFDRYGRLGLIAARTLVGPRHRLDQVSELMGNSPLGRPADLPGPAVCGFLACSSIVRRSAFLEVGGFHPLIFFAGEESLLAYDLMAAGWGLAYVDEVRAHHHPAAERDPTSRQALESRNAVLTAWMRRPVGTAARATFDLARAATRRPSARTALVQALRRLPRALRERRGLPTNVERQVVQVDRGQNA